MSPRSICSNPFTLATNSTNPCTKDPTKDSTMPNDSNNDKNLKPGSLDASIPHTRTEPRPDFTKPLPRSKLPAELQQTLDNEEKLWETVYEGQGPESTDSSLRYAGYAGRIRTILLSAHRYVAYTSDIGESFRPVAHPYLIKGAYGVSWAYLAGDVAHEGYKAYLRNQAVLHPETAADKSAVKADGNENREGLPPVTKLGAGITGPSVGAESQGRVVPLEDYRTVMAQRAIFQTVASMGLPAFTIHSIVKYAGKALKNNKNLKIRSYGPIGVS